jgi:hypothetical protein
VICVGVIFPNDSVIFGEVVELVTEPIIPLKVETLTDVTDPVAAVPDVGAHEALTENDAVPNKLPVSCDPLIIEAVICVLLKDDDNEINLD